MIDAANYSAMETLPDGRRIEIRAQRPQDRAGLRAALARASPESLYRRFFAVKRELSGQEADYFLDADFIEQVALLAVADEDGRPSIVGGARYIVVRPGQAEASFAVIDDYQAKGVGTVLMRHLAAIGREAGLREFFAEVLSENAPMLKVFERSGLTMSTRRDGMVVHVTLRFA
jgi:GNAT superfamily N-acetyltransferase